MITVNKTINSNQVNNIKSIHHVRISWEKYKNKKLVLQCLNCQKFGYSMNNGFKNSNCVEWLGRHRTIEGDKDDAAPPQCINCEGPHPAHFAGCPKFKDAISKKTKKKSRMLFKLRHITRNTKQPNSNDSIIEIDYHPFPSLSKTNTKVRNPPINNPIQTYSQITKQILKPPQSPINNISLFNDLICEIDKVISSYNIAELLRNIKRLNLNMQQATNSNDQLLAVMNFMSKNSNDEG